MQSLYYYYYTKHYFGLGIYLRRFFLSLQMYSVVKSYFYHFFEVILSAETNHWYRAIFHCAQCCGLGGTFLLQIHLISSTSVSGSGSSPIRSDIFWIAKNR